jgi:hypothetical protein
MTNTMKNKNPIEKSEQLHKTGLTLPLLIKVHVPSQKDGGYLYSCSDFSIGFLFFIVLVILKKTCWKIEAS